MENLFNSDGTFIPGYAEKLDPAFKDNPTLANTKDLKSMASQLVNSETLLGKKVEALIPAGGKPEDYVKFARQYLKVSDKVDLTNFAKPTDWPATIPWNDEIMRGFATGAVELGLMPWQAKKLFDWYNEVVRKFHEEVATAEDAVNAEATKQLKDTHKNNYDTFVAKATAVLNKYGGNVGADVAGKYANDPLIITLLGNIAAKMGEDFIREPGKDTSISAVTEAQAKIAKIMGDKTHAYFDKNNAAHDAATQEVKKLYEIVYPEPAAAR